MTQLTQQQIGVVAPVADGGRATSLRTLYRHWKARRGIARLRNVPQRMLEDIGLTRIEIEWALTLPLTVNASEALARKARLRRRGERGY